VYEQERHASDRPQGVRIVSTCLSQVLQADKNLSQDEMKKKKYLKL
jgi:hypothetical protein